MKNRFGELALICFGLAGCGGGGSTPAPPVATPPVTPTIQLSALQSSIDASSTVSLTWSGQAVNSCTATGDWNGAKATSGEQVVGPLYANSTFTLACQGAAGTATKTVLIEVRPISIVRLSSGVVTLSATAASLLVAETSSTLTFNSPIQIEVGDVFILNDVAHKATSVDLIAGQMVVGVVEPELAEIFDELRLAGAYNGHVASGRGLTKTMSTHQANRKAIAIAAGPVAAGGEFTADVVGDYDIDFTILGGLKKAYFTTQVSAQMTEGFIQLEPYEGTIPGPPVPLFVVALPAPGVFIWVDGRMELKTAVEFEVRASVGASMRVLARADYTAAEGLSGSADFSDAEASMDLSAASTNDPVTGGMTGTVTLVGLAETSLVAIGKTLVGLSVGVGPQLKVTASGPGDDLCLKGSVKPVIVSTANILRSKYEVKIVDETPLGNGKNIERGNCATATSLLVSIPATPTPTILRPIQVSVRLNSPVMGRGQMVDVSLSSASCRVLLNEQNEGSCMLTPESAGVLEAVAQYAGGQGTAPSVARLPVTVAKGMTATSGVSAGATPPGGSARFDISVSADTSDTTRPTGRLRVTDSNDTLICESSVAADSTASSCSAVVGTVGTYTLYAHYDGDANFFPSSSTVFVHTVEQTAQPTFVSTSVAVGARLLPLMCPQFTCQRTSSTMPFSLAVTGNYGNEIGGSAASIGTYQQSGTGNDRTFSGSLTIRGAARDNSVPSREVFAGGGASFYVDFTTTRFVNYTFRLNLSATRNGPTFQCGLTMYAQLTRVDDGFDAVHAQRLDLCREPPTLSSFDETHTGILPPGTYRLTLSTDPGTLVRVSTAAANAEINGAVNLVITEY
jgi:hypothetical protein